MLAAPQSHPLRQNHEAKPTNPAPSAAAQARLQLASRSESAALVAFQGKYERNAEGLDCVAIFDGGAFRLEVLDSHASLRHAPGAERQVTAQRVAAAAAPPPPPNKARKQRQPKPAVTASGAGVGEARATAAAEHAEAGAVAAAGDSISAPREAAATEGAEVVTTTAPALSFPAGDDVAALVQGELGPELTALEAEFFGVGRGSSWTHR